MVVSPRRTIGGHHGTSPGTLPSFAHMFDKSRGGAPGVSGFALQSGGGLCAARTRRTRRSGRMNQDGTTPLPALDPAEFERV
jgi:hypothetical protein